MGNDVVDVAAAFTTGGVSLLVTEPIKEQRQIAEQQEKGRQVQRAAQRVQDIEQRRQLAREERVRRARIQQVAETTGAAGGSGELGAVAALGTNVAAQQANISFGQDVATQLTRISSNIAASQQKIDLFNTIRETVVQGAQLAASAASGGAGAA